MMNQIIRRNKYFSMKLFNYSDDLKIAAIDNKKWIHITSIDLNKNYNSNGKKRNQSSSKNMINISSLNDGKGGQMRRFKNVGLKPLDDDEKKFIFKGRSSQMIKKLDLEGQDPEEFIKYEKELDVYARSEHDYHESIIEEDVKKRRRIKLGIIKKKMSQIENESETANKNFNNLLTWDAKEQIKYLNLNEPEVWTVEKICDTFPITEESCKKLLKSKWAPKTIDELCRHDQFVLENWKRLANEEQVEPGGPAINIYEELKRKNKVNLMKHAAGMPGVQFERRAQIFNDSYSVHETLLSPPGKFSKLVEKHDENIARKLLSSKENEAFEKELLLKKQNKKLNEHIEMTRKQLEKSFKKLKLN